jgi:hypothetical protein
MGRSGTEIANSLLGKSGTEREALAWAALASDEVPSYLLDKNKWAQIVATGTDAKGASRTLSYRVASRPVEVGTDEDPFLMPLWPTTADRYANRRGAILASQKIIDDRWNFAILKLPISPPPGFTIPGPDMEDVRSWIAHNKILQAQLAGSQALMSGGMKAVVSGPGLDGSKVAIYSTPFSGSGYLRPSAYPPAYQGYSTIHSASYGPDYSHGTWLVDRQGAQVDGEPVEDLMQLFVDPVLYTLVSDQGMFTPEFPNAGSGASLGKYSVSSEPAAGAETAPIANPPLAYSVTPTGEVLFHPDAVERAAQSYQKSVKIGTTVGAVFGGGLLVLSGAGLALTGLGVLAGALLGRKAAPKVADKLRASQGNA